jgi:hypothetical protein
LTVQIRPHAVWPAGDYPHRFESDGSFQLKFGDTLMSAIRLETEGGRSSARDSPYPSHTPYHGSSSTSSAITRTQPRDTAQTPPPRVLRDQEQQLGAFAIQRTDIVRFKSVPIDVHEKESMIS